jgi:hypothetical protein
MLKLLAEQMTEDHMFALHQSITSTDYLKITNAWGGEERYFLQWRNAAILIW